MLHCIQKLPVLMAECLFSIINYDILYTNLYIQLECEAYCLVYVDSYSNLGEIVTFELFEKVVIHICNILSY